MAVAPRVAVGPGVVSAVRWVQPEWVRVRAQALVPVRVRLVFVVQLIPP